MKKVRVIITGATGMVGEGVLLECLQNPAVEQILVVNRKPGGVSHPKLREIVHGDFFSLEPLESQVAGYNSCFFCLGVSSVGLGADEYRRLTYDLTINFASMLAKKNPDLTFCYVTGKGTDSTEQGKLAWARVKGQTENALMKLFRRAYMFRPAMMKATAGQKNLKFAYRALAWIYPLGRAVYPKGFCTLAEVARVMIYVAEKGFAKPILEVEDIVKLA